MGGFMSNFMLGFGKSFATSAVDSFGEDTDLGLGLAKGATKKFGEHVADRKAALGPMFADHVKKLDVAQRQAKDLMSLIGEVDETGLATNLSSSEATARIMRNKTTTEIDEHIKTFRGQRTNEGLDIRSHYADFFKRGEQEDAIQYTAKDIAKMQVGAFKYKPQQFNLANNRTGLFNLASGVGLFTETAQDEQKALNERQRQRITRNLPRFDEVSQPSTRAEARSGINLPGNLLRSAASRTAEKLSKLEITKVENDIANAKVRRSEQAVIFKDARRNSDLQYRKLTGSINDEEIARRDTQAKRAFDGSDLLLNAGDALKKYTESPTPENAKLVRETSRLVTQHQLTIKAYENASALVTANLAANSQYSKQKTREGLSPFTNNITEEQRSQIRETEWKNVFTQTVSTLDESNVSLVNPDMFGLNIKPEWVKNELDYIKIGKVGTRISGTNGTERETLTAGVRALDSNLSDEEVNERVASLMAHKSASRNQANQVKAIRVQKGKGDGDDDEKKKTAPTGKRRVTQEQYDADIKEIARLEEQLKIEQETLSFYRAGENDKTGDSRSRPIERGIARDSMLKTAEKLEELKKKVENYDLKTLYQDTH